MAASRAAQADGGVPDGRASWPYLATPISIYLLVMLPICGFEAFLLLADCPNWMRISAGMVVLLTIHGFLRGYARRLVLSPHAARFHGPLGHFEIPWAEVRRIDVYIPGGGLGVTSYLYITTRSTPPEGKWDIGPEVIQVQNRPGLLEAVRAFHDQALASRCSGER